MDFAVQLRTAVEDTDNCCATLVTHGHIRTVAQYSLIVEPRSGLGQKKQWSQGKAKPQHEIFRFHDLELK